MIRPPEEITFGQRILLTIVIVLVILFALALMGWISGGWDEAPAAPATPVPMCSDEPGINDKLNEIAFEALESAYRGHIQNLFMVWMKDPNAAAGHRAGQGVKNGAVAYLHARKGILDWNIPTCEQQR